MLCKKIELTEECIERFWNKVDKKSDDECWGWHGVGDQYGRCRIRIMGKKYLSYRVSWVIHHGDIPEGLCVCHTCDNPVCTNPAHLFLGSQRDNILDMEEKGRALHLAGEQHYKSKLTEKEVVEILQKYVPFVYTTGMLAKEYGVERTTISCIINGKTWKYIDRDWERSDED